MTTPRKVVVLSHTGLRSGAESVLLRNMGWLHDAGAEVELLTSPGPLAEAARERAITTTATPNLKLPALPRPLAVIVTAIRGVIAGILLRRRARGADLVLLNGLLGLPALWVARRLRLRVPAIWVVHDVIHRRDWLLLLRLVGPSADRAIAVSDAAGRPLVDLGLPVQTVPNGTGWPVDPRPEGANDPLVIGCAGLLTPWKGQNVLLDAVAPIPNVRVQLAGGSFPKDSEYAERLRNRAAEPDLRGRVDFLGQVSDPLATMREWDIGVSPSVDPEAGPLALLEYLSVALPVVATDHGGTSELLAAAPIGLAVRPRDVAGLRQAIETLVEDPALRRSMGTRGRTVIQGRYTLDHQREEFLAVISDVLDADPGATPR